MKKSVSSPDSAPTMPQNPLLVPEASDPTLARLLLRSTSELADATRPSFLANDHSPVQWPRSDWDRLEANREPLFDMSAVAAQFDHASFSRDGYAVLREVMTPETVEAWTAALKYGSGTQRQIAEVRLDTDRLANPRENTTDKISNR